MTIRANIAKAMWVIVTFATIHVTAIVRALYLYSAYTKPAKTAAMRTNLAVTTTVELLPVEGRVEL